MRKLLAIGAAVGTVFLVAGCTPKFDGEIKGKPKGDDDVQIKFKVCLRDTSTKEDDCQPPPTRATRGDDAIHHLLAFRMPKGTDVPDGFRARDSANLYERNRSYGRELKRLAPTPDDTKWFGFVSEAIKGGQNRDRYKLRFGLPNDPGNVFKHRPVTGYSDSDGQLNCGDDAFEPSKESGADAICISDPTTRSDVRKSLKIELD